MKRYLIYFCVVVFTLLLSISNVSAREINVYFFHGDGCPHCAAEEEFFSNYHDDNLNVVSYEVWNSEENSEFLDNISNTMEFKIKGVPVTIIGDTVISGYSDSLSKKIDRAIKYYEDENNKYRDAVKEIQDGTYQKDESNDGFDKKEEKIDDELTVNIPFFGKVNLKKLSLASSAVIIGFIDGFNPCAMWVLLFLISILLGMKNRKKIF